MNEEWKHKENDTGNPETAKNKFAWQSISIRTVKTQALLSCRPSQCTTCPTSGPLGWRRRTTRGRRTSMAMPREAPWWWSRTSRCPPMADIFSLTVLPSMLGNPTAWIGRPIVNKQQTKSTIVKHLTVFTFPGAPPPTWQWRPCPLLPALLSRSAPSQTGARLISFCVNLFFFAPYFQKNPLCRKKHPVVPEQYARVVGFGDPMDSEALWGSKNLHMPFLARSWWTPPEVFADEQYFLVIC